MAEACSQTKCIFHKSHGAEMLCPECEECGAESNIIKDNCVNCWNCLKDAGYVRKGTSRFQKELIASKKKQTIRIEVKQ